MAFTRSFPPLDRQRSAQARLLEEAPYLARCSYDKTATQVRPRQYATRYPYMQVNRRDVVSWLVFDVDEHTNAWIWHDEGLPAPNLIVRNRNSGSFHLYYAIQPVMTGVDARSRPIAYMKAVYAAMRDRLQADVSYSGPVSKTPGHPWWSTTELHDHEYSLGELADYVELAIKPLWSTGPNLDDVAHSRHCTLFEELRYYAYSIVTAERESGTFSHFYQLLEAYAFNRNATLQRRGFSVPLTAAQVKATVKSVARWTWDRYTGCSSCHRGVMALDDSLPVHERQRLAAQRTHTRRRTATESRVRRACRELQQAGSRLTQTAVAAAAGLARQTVARYRQILDEVQDQSDGHQVAPLRQGQRRQPGNVNYAVYQITARLQRFPLRLLCGLFIDSVAEGRLRFYPVGGPPDTS